MILIHDQRVNDGKGHCLAPTHRFCPTPGLSEIMEMLCCCKVAFGPIPETMSNCGDCKVPADKMTSFLAEIVKIWSPVSTNTPVAVVFSNKIFLAKVWV